VTVIIEVNSESYFPQLREYCPSAFETWTLCLHLREIRLTIDLDASRYLYNIKSMSATVANCGYCTSTVKATSVKGNQ